MESSEEQSANSSKGTNLTSDEEYSRARARRMTWTGDPRVLVLHMHGASGMRYGEYQGLLFGELLHD